MATASPPSPRHDLEGATSYFPIPAGPGRASSPAQPRRSKKLLAGILFSSFLLISLILALTNQTPASQVKPNNISTSADHKPSTAGPPSRGVSQGVSEKVFRRVGGGGLGFSWNNVMLSWQRTAFHFQPEKNWMNGWCAAQFLLFSIPCFYIFILVQ